MKNVYLRSSYLEIIKQKYNILLHVSQTNFDLNFNEFEENIKSLKKEYFLPNERILIEITDTQAYDVYNKETKYGLLTRNIIDTFIEYDIPLFTMFIVTNNFYLREEINTIVPEQANNITVFFTLRGFSMYGGSSKFLDRPFCFDKIKKNCLTILGYDRLHRRALYQVLKNKKEKIAISYRKVDNKNF